MRIRRLCMTLTRAGAGQSQEEQLADPRRKLLREWHTDWPHDLSAYGAGEKHFEEGKQGWGQRNAGCIRQVSEQSRVIAQIGRYILCLTVCGRFMYRSAAVSRRLHVLDNDLVFDRREREDRRHLDRPRITPRPPQPGKFPAYDMTLSY
jgi:hypothetical protein